MDMNNTKDFIKAVRDFSTKCTVETSSECEQCTLSVMDCTAFDELSDGDIDDLIDKVGRMVKHHKKTYLDDFKEKFPNAKTWDKDYDSRPTICRNTLYGNVIGKCRNCKECWNEPMIENE